MKIIMLILAMLFALPVAADSARGWAKFYDTTGSKQIMTRSSRLQSMQAFGGTSNVQVFDDEDGTCDENALTGTITLTADAPAQVFGYEMSHGICVLITGSSPEVTVVVR